MKTIKNTKSNTTNIVKTAAVSPSRKKSAAVAAAEAPAAAATLSRREINSDLIAARAYTIWEQQGRPQGNDLQNWLQAESQLKQEIQSFTA